VSAGSSAARPKRHAPRSISTHRGARNPNRGANSPGHAADRRERHNGAGQSPSLLGAIGIPNRSASLPDPPDGFGTGEARVRSPTFRCNTATSSTCGLDSAVFVPRPRLRRYKLGRHERAFGSRLPRGHDVSSSLVQSWGRVHGSRSASSPRMRRGHAAPGTMA